MPWGVLFTPIIHRRAFLSCVQWTGSVLQLWRQHPYQSLPCLIRLLAFVYCFVVIPVGNKCWIDIKLMSRVVINWPSTIAIDHFLTRMAKCYQNLLTGWQNITNFLQILLNITIIFYQDGRHHSSLFKVPFLAIYIFTNVSYGQLL